MHVDIITNCLYVFNVTFSFSVVERTLSPMFYEYRLPDYRGVSYVRKADVALKVVKWGQGGINHNNAEKVGS